ncbi:G-type lectin S-receptor-like serine/threonine-protein kinase RLK1 [Morella rubra]|uniref:non-specific serine/threonine protein kinase n=1 Tax=Morella rubra TaxID=262757 RepID=A0A6A1WKS8_9ROSI|nr:G-type lectin S-receptor-like serine/threonine-protein kinase RLK1 [Morella rubra]
MKVGLSTLSTDGNVQIERKKEDQVEILIVGASLVAFAFLVEEELGRGAFGTIYKGTIWSGEKHVAVKRLDKLLVERGREFQTEMKVIRRTHHRNLVRLLGYCNGGPNRLLVYEYMVNGSLAYVLFTQEILTWNERMRIARNIARGILYLHEECEPHIIHCDIKPENILMDEQRHPKISNFGLAKLLKPDQTQNLYRYQRDKGICRTRVASEAARDSQSRCLQLRNYIIGDYMSRCSVDYNLPEEAAILEEWAYQCFEHGELVKLLNDEHVDQ